MGRLFHCYQEVLAQTPSDSLALIGPDGALSFAQLNAWAHHLIPQFDDATHLTLYLPPSGGFFASVVAGMLAGIPLTLLDPETPVSESHQTSEGLVLTCPELQSRAQTSFPCSRIQLVASFPQVSSPLLSVSPASQPVLHRLVTSGSSGQPSLVTIGRDAVWLHYQEMDAHYQYQPQTLNANLTRHTSAAGINGFWRVLLAGAGFVYADLKQESLSAIYQRLKQHGMTSLQGIGPLLEALAQIAPAGERLKGLQRIIFGGQSLSPAQLKKIAVILPEDCAFSFNYSSSETLQITAYSAPLKTVLQRSLIPCGQALPSREIRLLGPSQEAVEPGESGEIVVLAEQIALDIQSPTAAERFYLDPDEPARRVYHTRDLGRWNAAGELEYLGRIDRQIKAQGVRIDPVSVEQALEALPEISAAAVLGLPAHGRTQLVACLVSEGLLDKKALYHALSKTLPSAWIPRFWLPFEALPLQSSGKIDYPRLKQQAQQALKGGAAGASIEKTSHLAVQLRQLWADVLGYPLEEDNPSFMLVGGDSLRANQLVSHLNNLGYGPLNTLWVAQNPTLASQVEALSQVEPFSQSPSQHGLPDDLVSRLPQPHERDKILQYIGWV